MIARGRCNRWLGVGLYDSSLGGRDSSHLPLVLAAEDAAADGRLDQAEMCGHRGAREADLQYGAIAEEAARLDERRKGVEGSLTRRGSGMPTQERGENTLTH